MTQVPMNYAGALYTLALEEGVTDRFLQEMETLARSFAAEPDFLRFLSIPNIDKQERSQAVDDLLRGKVHPYMLNFLKVLTEEGYARYFGDCCQGFRQMYDKDNSILRVTAVTAIPMTQSQSVRMTEKLSAITGKTVVLTNTVEPACLGGVKLRYDSVQVDDTIHNRLMTVESMLKNTQL